MDKFPLNCPFCGSEPEVWSHKNNHYVECSNPDCLDVSTHSCNSREFAIESWNTRVVSNG